MRPDQFLRLLSEQTGERLLALDLDCAVAWSAKTAAAPAPKAADKIAVVPLQGVLTPKGVSMFGFQLSPGMSAFRAKLEEAASNPEVGAIIIPTDTPGGTVRGTPETAAAVKAAAARKPVVAYVDGVNASGGVWITSQATAIWSSPSSELGSLGVMGTHMDISGMLEADGVKPTIIRSKSAPFKNEATNLEPLSEAARAAWQAEADEAEDDFLGTVAQGRKVSLDQVRADFGQGRMMPAKKALDVGLIDRIGTVSELLSSLRTQGGTVRKRFSALAFD